MLPPLTDAADPAVQSAGFTQPALWHAGSVFFVVPSPRAPHVTAFALLALGAGAGCTTARGLADAGQLAPACRAVTAAPSPLFDDDAPALASRVRQRLPGAVSARLLDAAALLPPEARASVRAPRDLVEFVVDDNVYSDVGTVVFIDAVGTEVPVHVVDEATVLSMTGAPAPPEPTWVTSTHTPGPIETAIKGIGIVTIGLPLSIATLGILSPDLGGLFSTGTNTSTSAVESPELPAWRARADVQAAVALSSALGVSAPRCTDGRCRVVVAVQHAAHFQRARMAARLDLEGCSLPDTLVVPLPRTTTTTSTPLSTLPADTRQWERFAATRYGLDPLLDDIGDGVDDCCDALDALDDCCS